MSMLNSIGLRVGRKKSEDVPAPSLDDDKKEPNINTADEERQGSIAFDDATKGTDVPVEEAAQRGVQKVEAATSAWSKWALAAALCKCVSHFFKVQTVQLIPSHSIWLIFLTNGMRIAILFSLVPYVTSDFQSHSLLTTIGIVADTMSAASYIPVAKMLDVWGRAEGFLLMTGFATLGLILMASATHLAIFCAAQV